MIQYLIDNKEWIFSGIGCLVLGFFFSKSSTNKIKQKQKSGKNSNNYMAGRDLTIEKKDE